MTFDTCILDMSSFTMHMPDLDVLDCIISINNNSIVVRTLDYVVYACHLPSYSIKSHFFLWSCCFFCFSWRYSPHIPSTDSYPRMLTQEPGRRCGRSPVIARLQPPQLVVDCRRSCHWSDGTSHVSTSICSRKISKVSCSRIDWNVLNCLWKKQIKIILIDYKGMDVASISTGQSLKRPTPALRCDQLVFCVKPFRFCL